MKFPEMFLSDGGLGRNEGRNICIRPADPDQGI